MTVPINIEVVRPGLRGNRWSEVRINLPRWRSWRLAYSPVLKRFANGRNIDAARRQPDFRDNEFEIVQAIEAALAAAKSENTDAITTNEGRKLAMVRKVVERHLKRHPAQAFSMNALAKAIAPACTMRDTRIRTHYLPMLAKSSPSWDRDGKFWQHRQP